jgi:hypothetical protein
LCKHILGHAMAQAADNDGFWKVVIDTICCHFV